MKFETCKLSQKFWLEQRGSFYLLKQQEHFSPKLYWISRGDKWTYLFFETKKDVNAKQNLQDLVATDFCSLCTLCLHFLAPAGSTNERPHVLQLWSFFPKCLFLWIFRLFTLMNSLGQRSHLYFFSPLCFASQFFLEVYCLNFFPQPSNLHGIFFSPVCNVRCLS